MIPTLLLVGFVFGWWWKVTVPVATVAWPAWLIAVGIDSRVEFAIEAGALAFANVVVGVLVFQATFHVLMPLTRTGRSRSVEDQPDAQRRPKA